jgi:hypothetical protein
MSSGFVSGGTSDNPIEHDDEWHAAQAELEASRARKAAEARESDGRSLFETLEANKGMKDSRRILVTVPFPTPRLLVFR